MAKKTVSDLSKSGQVNGFTGGINTDLHPMLQPNDTLTDCLNGTLITYNGNENMLQNDMGNYELKNAKLPAGYIPMGMKEHQGILYMILMNPVTKQVEIGSYPSPQTNFGSLSNPEEYKIEPVPFGTLENLEDDSLSERIWNIIDSEDEELKRKYLYTCLDTSKSLALFTKTFDNNSMLTKGDEYLLAVEAEDTEHPFQTLKYFTTNKEGETTDINSTDVYIAENVEDDLNSVAWDSNGWLGAKFDVDVPKKIDQNIKITKYGISDEVSVSEYRKNTNVSEVVANKSLEFEYSLKLDGLDLNNRVSDFKSFVESENAADKMILLSGSWGTLNTDSVEFPIHAGGSLYGVKTPISAPEYKVESSNIKEYTYCVCNKLDLDMCKTKWHSDITDYYVRGVFDFNVAQQFILSGVTKNFWITENTVLKNIHIGLPYDDMDLDNKIMVLKYPKNYTHLDDITGVGNIEEYAAGDIRISDAFDSINLPIEDNSWVLYGECNDSADSIKVGLNGSLEGNTYTVSEKDSVKALKAFLESIDPDLDFDILLPKNLKIDSIPGSKGSYIITFAGNVEAGNNIKVYSDTLDEVIVSTVKTSPKPIFEYQFSLGSFIIDSHKIIPVEVKNAYVDGEWLNLTIAKSPLDFTKALTSVGGSYTLDGSTSLSYTTEAAACYRYLFGDFKIVGSIYTWYQDDNGNIGNRIKTSFKTILPGTIEKNGVLQCVVPPTFTGSIVDNETVIVGNTKWTEDLACYVGDVSSEFSNLTQTLQIVVDNPDGLNIATKVSVGTNNKYYDLTEGKLLKDFNDDLTRNTTIKSVPYKVDENNHLCIYDNLIAEDSTNYSENVDETVAKFNYYIDDENKLHVNLSVYGVVTQDNILASASVYKLVNGNFVILNSQDVPDNSNSSVTDEVEFALSLGSEELLDDFIFLKLNLGKEVIFPIYTKMSERVWTEKKDKYQDFTKMYADELFGNNSSEGNSAENIESQTEKYMTCALNEEDEIIDIVHESELPYYWYNGIKNRNYSSDGTTSKIFGFGKGVFADTRINLTEKGILEGDIIDISGLGMNYSNVEVNVQNMQLFEKIGDSVYLKVKTMSKYYLHKYEVSDSSEAIPVRKYLIKHCAPPITHSEKDLGWTNTPIGDYTGWTGDNVFSYKSLNVAKTNASNSVVQLNAVSAVSGDYDEKSNTFKKGSALNTKSQINNAIKSVTTKDSGNDSLETNQLFTLVKAKLDTDEAGFTIPVPKMKWGEYDTVWTKNKKNKGTNSAVVLMRDSSGLSWVNKLKDAVAYTGIAGGIAGVATTVVMGCIAASTAFAAGASAALACIPFVGWAVLAAAVIAASIYLLVKVTDGENQDFEFFAMRGSENHPLIIPLWGKHLGKKDKDQSEHPNKQWIMKNFKRSSIGHPWYLDPNFTHAEELITFIMTHVYYYAEGPKLKLGNNQGTIIVSDSKLTITVKSKNASVYKVKKYAQIVDQLCPTNNFSTSGVSTNATFKYSIDTETLNNTDDWVQSQSVENLGLEDKTYFLDTEFVSDSSLAKIKNEIINEFETFVNNLGGNGPNVYYKDDNVRESEQEAFGGNAGGRNCKFKCKLSGNFKLYKMIDGDYPVKGTFLPIAFGIKAQASDPVMVKDLGWNSGSPVDSWGTSITTYQAKENEWKKGSKYWDFIKWDSYSNEFKLTCNTNDI